jgi:hypothetical protein
MAPEPTEPIESIRQRTIGSVITPEDQEYNQARSVWNAAIDQNPAVIVRRESAQDVAATLGFGQAARSRLQCAVVRTVIPIWGL